MTWKIVYTKQAKKDSLKLKSAGLKKNTLKILGVIKSDPFFTPPAFKKLVGDLKGAYSRRINVQHRIIYQVYKNDKIVKILRMWTHYE